MGSPNATNPNPATPRDTAYARRGRRASVWRDIGALRDSLRARPPGGPQRLTPSQADALLARNRQAAPGLGPQGQGALGRGNLPPGPQPINPAAGVFNAQPVSPAFQAAQQYVAQGPWQPGAGGTSTTQPLPYAPSVDDTPTLPGQQQLPPGDEPTLPRQGGRKMEPLTPGERALQGSLRGVSVRLDRLSNVLSRNVPTPGGIAPLIWTLLVLLVAVVPVSVGGATRLKLLWEVLTNSAFLPGVQYSGAYIPGVGAPPGQGSGGSGGTGGTGGIGSAAGRASAPASAARAASLTPLRIPTSLPLGDWGPSVQTGPVRIPGRALAGGGQHSRVAATLASGQRRGTHGGIPISGGPGTPTAPPSGGGGTGLSSGFGPTPRPSQPLRFGPRRAAER